MKSESTDPVSEPAEREPLEDEDGRPSTDDEFIDEALRRIRSGAHDLVLMNAVLAADRLRTALRAAEDRADRYEKLHRSQRAKTATAESSLTRYKTALEEIVNWRLQVRRGSAAAVRFRSIARAALEESPEDRDQ